jgi:hypothetical protein
VFQRPTEVPDACANTSTNYYHVPLDQTSFQFGRSLLYETLNYYVRKDATTNADLKTFLRFEQPYSSLNGENSIRRYIWDHSIPNPPNNITRLYYDLRNDALETGIPWFSENNVPLDSVFAGDLGTRLAMQDQNQAAQFKSNTSQSTFGFPFQSPVLDANFLNYYGGNFTRRGLQDPVWYVGQLKDGSLLANELPIHYFHSSISGQGCSATVPINANSLAVGCDHYGCEFGLQAATCSSQSVLLQNFGNSFYSPRQKDNNSMTGCGIVRVDMVKKRFDPWFRQICCRNNWSSFLQYSNSSSLTVKTSFVYGLATYSSGPPVVPTLYSPQTVYCDPSWQPGNAACDVELGAFCGTQQSYSTRLGGTVSVALAEGHPCNAWYNGVMFSYTQNNITQRNIDIVEDLVQRYCLKYPNDSISCQCVSGFSSKGYYTEDTGKTYGLIAVNSLTQHFYTDALCSSVPCTNNLNSFDLSGGYRLGADTLVPPSVIQAKRHCPLGICYLINDGMDLTGTNITALNKINIANIGQFCTISGTNQIQSLSVNYDVVVSGYDNISGVVGRYFYTSEGYMTPDNGIARVQVRVSVSSNITNNQVVLQSTISGNSALFQFASPQTISNPTFPLSAPTYNLLLEPVPGANLLVAARNSTGFLLNTFTATLTTQINGSPQMTKVFPVRIILQPLSGAPTPSPKQIDLTVPSLHLPPAPQFSRTTWGVLLLSGVLLFYSLAFILEMVEIRNFQNKIKMNFSPTP